MTVRAISLGGGHQSTALVVLAIAGEIDFPLAIMANVGDRAENPATLTYLSDHLMPYAQRHGYELVVRRWVDRSGRERDLYDDIASFENRSIDIPVYMSGGAPGTRKCTDRYKIAVVGRELRRRGASAADPAVVAVGISVDGIERVNRRHAAPWEKPVYPLVDLGMTRADCDRVVADAGLPIPPKSSCWFCPFRPTSYWSESRLAGDGVFEAGVALEDRLNEKRAMLDRDPVFLVRDRKPLRTLEGASQGSMIEGPDTCDSGYCWT